MKESGIEDLDEFLSNLSAKERKKTNSEMC